MSSGILRDLLVEWGFDIDLQPLIALDKSIGALKTEILKIGTAAVASAGAMFGIADSAVKAGLDLKNMSRVLNTPIEELDKLRFAAESAGLSSQELDGFLSGLQRASLDAATGVGALNPAFIRLGLDLRDRNMNLKGSADLLSEIMDKIKGVRSETERQLLATQLSPSLGPRLFILLDAIERVKRAPPPKGVLFSAKEVEAAASYSTAILTFEKTLTRLRLTIGTALLPVVAEVSGEIARWIDRNKGLIASGVLIFAHDLGDGFRLAVRWLHEINAAFNDLFGITAGGVGSIRLFVHLLEAMTLLKAASALIGITSAIGSLCTNPYALAIAGIGGLIALFLKTNNIKMTDIRSELSRLADSATSALSSLQSSFASLKQGAEQSAQSVEASFQDILHAATQAVLPGKDFFSQYLSGYFEIGKSAGQALGLGVNAIIDNLEDSLNGLTKIGQRIAAVVVDVLEGYWANAFKNIKSDIDFLLGSVNSLLSLIGKLGIRFRVPEIAAELNQKALAYSKEISVAVEDARFSQKNDSYRPSWLDGIFSGHASSMIAALGRPSPQNSRDFMGPAKTNEIHIDAPLTVNITGAANMDRQELEGALDKFHTQFQYILRASASEIGASHD